MHKTLNTLVLKIVDTKSEHVTYSKSEAEKALKIIPLYIVGSEIENNSEYLTLGFLYNTTSKTYSLVTSIPRANIIETNPTNLKNIYSIHFVTSNVIKIDTEENQTTTKPWNISHMCMSGFLVQESEEHISLAKSMYYKDNGEIRYVDIVSIPKNLITKLVKIY